MIKLKDIIAEASSEKTYYHVSPTNYNVGDIIKPYFDSDKYREDSFGPDIALGIKYCF